MCTDRPAHLLELFCRSIMAAGLLLFSFLAFSCLFFSVHLLCLVGVRPPPKESSKNDVLFSAASKQRSSMLPFLWCEARLFTAPDTEDTSSCLNKRCGTKNSRNTSVIQLC